MRVRFTKVQLAIPVVFIAVGSLLALNVGAMLGMRRGALSSKEAPLEVSRILTRSCADCHASGEALPWEASSPVVGDMVRDDARKARKILDLSRWRSFPSGLKTGYLAAIANAVMRREMPPARYWYAHPHARLSDEEVEAITAWASNEGHHLREMQRAGFQKKK